MATCVPWELDSGCCDEWEEIDPLVRERAETLAWDTLRTLSAGRVGTCPVTMRPCLTSPCDFCRAPLNSYGDVWVRPYIRDGEWHNMVCGGDRCSCTRLCEIVFPGPVAAVVEVTVDDVDLPATGYRIDNGNRLVRQDGGCWPSCQDMSAPLGQPGTVGITYVPGIVPDDAGLWAAGVLACEFVKACTGGKCRLPTSVTSVARQGVSFTMATSMWDRGMTGIREVDAYLVSVNPHAHLVPPLVWSPDVPWAGHRYQTTTATVEP